MCSYRGVSEAIYISVGLFISSYVFRVTYRLIKDIMDTDLFWEKELLRANDDVLFSCSIGSGSSGASADEFIKGLCMSEPHFRRGSLYIVQ